MNKLTLSLDTFLYACKDSYKGRKKGKQFFDSHIQFEPFLLGHGIEIKSSDDLSQKLLEIAQHHFYSLPHLKRGEEVTLENISYFSMSVATFFRDIERIFLLATDKNLPPVPSFNESEISKSSSKTLKLGKNWEEFFDKKKSKDQEFNIDPDMIENFWDTLRQILRIVFGPYEALYWIYIHWTLIAQKGTKPKDFRIFPPVGEDYARLVRSRVRR